MSVPEQNKVLTTQYQQQKQFLISKNAYIFLTAILWDFFLLLDKLIKRYWLWQSL